MRNLLDSYITNNLRLFVSAAAGLLFFIALIASTVFFLNVRGAEQVMMPNVQGYELTSALLELQSKELYPRIQLRYTQSSADRGLILEQSPPPGSIVRAGRRINLVISQGAIINTVENYVGRNIDDVRIELYSLLAAHTFTGGGGILGAQPISLSDPLIFEFSSEPAGTILQQWPEPGTNITGPTTLQLVVSHGMEHTTTNVPNFLGFGLTDTLDQISLSGIDFEFFIREAQTGETPGTIVAQTPAGGTVAQGNPRVDLVMTVPQDIPPNHVFGLFTFDMARNPYPLLTFLESIRPDGQRQSLLTTRYAGGRLTVPYIQPAGSVLVLHMLNREIHRVSVP